MIPAPFDYKVPETIGEATDLMGRHKDTAKVLAGGHSLIPILKLRLAQPRILIDIGRLGELRGIEKKSKNRLLIGALTTHRDLEDSKLAARWAPLLRETAASIGDAQVRNRGTIGGSVVHADPAADYPATLLVLEATIRARSSASSRSLKISNFFVDFYTTRLRPEEIVTQIEISLPRRTGSAYLKFADKASGYAICGAAALVRTKDKVFEEVRLAFNGVAASPFRAVVVERALVGQATTARSIRKACQAATEGMEVLSHAQVSESYRRHLAAVMGERAIREAVRRQR